MINKNNWPIEVFRIGFLWGNAKVKRTTDGKNRFLEITTPRGAVDVRITKSGLIRVEEVYK